MERIQHERLVVATLAAAGQDGVLPSIDGLDLLLGMTQQEAVEVDPETAELKASLGLPS